MPIKKVHRENNNSQYFITMTVNKWYHVFERYDRWNILADSLQYYQKNKDLEIYAYVFMKNHIHMIVQSHNIIGFLRDFKKYTSKELKKNLQRTEPRVLKLFINEKTGKYNFWQMSNKPKMMGTEKFFLQKLNYIHFNPVRKGYVEQPECWEWSSANPNSKIKTENIW